MSEPEHGAAPSAVGRCALLWALVALILAFLLARHADEGWRYIHDDNGARYSSYARTHLRLGLARTHGLDFFYDAQRDALVPYGHHPPILGLLLAGWFRASGHDTPLVARLVPFAFHLVTAWLVIGLLVVTFRPWPAALGAFAFAVVPMSSYFGKLVNFEPLTLPFVVVAVVGYWRWAEGDGRGRLGPALGAAALGTLVDWTSLFALIVIVGDAALRWMRGRGDRFGRAVLVAGGLGLATVAALTTWLATGPAGLEALLWGAQSRIRPKHYTAADWFAKVWLYNVHFFTRPVRQAALAAVALLAARALLRRPFAPRERLLVLFGIVGLLNVLAFPGGAFFHAYWQFYWLPFMALSLAYVADFIDPWLPPVLRPLVFIAVAVYCGSEALRHLGHIYEEPSVYVASRLSAWRDYL